MIFKPKTPEQIALENLLPEGKYPFTVIKAEETTSRKGADMIKVQLLVYGSNNRQFTVFDYLMESMIDKLYKFCCVVGLEEHYNSGTLTGHDCQGREGWAHIKIQPARDGYEASNTVSYYCQEPERKPQSLPPTPVREPRALPPAGDLDGDEIPF